MALRGCPFLNKLYLLKDVELHCSLCKYSGVTLHKHAHVHITLHTQHRVSIPDLFPVQQLSAVNFIISLIRLSQIKKKIMWSSFPSSLRCICNRRKMEWICSIKLMEVLWTVLYAKGKTVPIKLNRVAKKKKKITKTLEIIFLTFSWCNEGNMTL